MVGAYSRIGLLSGNRLGVGSEYYSVVRVLIGYDMVFRALVWYAGWLGHTVEWVC